MRLTGRTEPGTRMETRTAEEAQDGQPVPKRGGKERGKCSLSRQHRPVCRGGSWSHPPLWLLVPPSAVSMPLLHPTCEGFRLRGSVCHYQEAMVDEEAEGEKCWYLVGSLLFSFIRSGTSSPQNAATHIQSGSSLPQTSLSVHDRSVPYKSKPSDSKSSQMAMKINYHKHQLLLCMFSIK